MERLNDKDVMDLVEFEGIDDEYFHDLILDNVPDYVLDNFIENKIDEYFRTKR